MDLNGANVVSATTVSIAATGKLDLYDNDFIYKIRKIAQELLYSVLFVEARNNYGDSAALVHSDA